MKEPINQLANSIQLTGLFTKIWNEGKVPKVYKNAFIVYVYKRKGDRSCGDNHRGITLLSFAGKALARVLLNRLLDHVLLTDVLPESQCGFQAGRGTTYVIFALRQIQENCREYLDLYMIFIDLTKIFNSINREVPCNILVKIGCPAILSLFCNDAAGGLPRLRPWSAHSIRIDGSVLNYQRLQVRTYIIIMVLK